MATQYFLRNAASDLGGAGQKLLSTTRGSASTTKVTNTVASGDNIEVTDGAGGQALTWLTDQLNPITITGNITVNIRGLESATQANAAAGVRIERMSGDGATVLGTLVPITSVPTASNEYTTADTAKNAAIIPTSTSIAGGNRIRVTLYVRAAAGTAMGGGRTVTNSIDGPTAGAAGDTYVTFTENLSTYSGRTAFPQVVSSVAALGAAIAKVGATISAQVLGLVTTIPTPPRPQAQFVQTVGTAVKGSSSLNTVLTLGAGVNVTAGNRLVVAWSGETTTVSSAITCIDSKGNTYQGFGKVTDPPAATLAIGFFTAPVTTALIPGDTITVIQGGDAKPEGVITVQEWSGLTIPGQQNGTTGTSTTPASGNVTTDAGSVYFGLLQTWHASSAVTGSLGAPWTSRMTQTQTTTDARWYGLWTQQTPTGETVNFQPTLGSSTLWGAALFTLTAGTEPPTPALVYSWVGGITSSGAVVVAKATLTSTMRLVVSTDSALGNPIYSSSVTPDAQGYGRLTISGLSANTQYYYGVELNGVITGFHGQFQTAHATFGNITFAIGSCATIQNLASLTRALARTPRLAIFTGDFPYIDVSANDQALVRDAREALVTRPEVHEFLRKVPSAYTWSDHDFGTNNSDGNAASKPAQQAVYRQMVPHHTLVESTGIYHAFTYGRVRFILTDNRSNKSPQANTDNSSKTLLGATQKQWFKDQITNATERLTIWINENPWIGAAVAGEDEWSGYTTERTELANHISSSGKRVIIMSGDMHAVAYDNGANSAGSIPVFHAAPLAETSSSKGGPYTLGPSPAAGAQVQQYGFVTITDSGSTMTVEMVGYSNTNTAAISATIALITPVPIAAVASFGAVTPTTNATAMPATIVAVAALPEATAEGDPPTAQPDTVAVITYMGTDISPPSVPTGLHQTGQTTTTVDLAWNASTDNMAVARYEVVVTGPV